MDLRDEPLDLIDAIKDEPIWDVLVDDNDALQQPANVKVELCENVGELSSPHEKAKYSCSFCDVTFKYKKDLSAHVAKSHPNVRPFRCQCGQGFKTEFALKRHKLYVHSRERPFQCECGKSFKEKNNLKTHMAVHLEEKRFQCCCGKDFKTRKCLLVHSQVHSNLRLFKCNCGKAFKTKIILRRHALVHSNSFDTKRGLGLQHLRAQTNSKLSLSKCSNLDRMERKHLNQAPIRCVCGAKFTKKKDLRIHMASHFNAKAPFLSCNICGWRFQQDYELKSHNLRVHSLLVFDCEICAYKDTEHSYAMPERCKNCQNLSRLRNNQIQLRRERGSGSDKYECTVCEALCETLVELYAHGKSHRFECTLCEKVYKSQSELDEHHAVIHRPFTRIPCKKRYVYQTALILPRVGDN